MPLQPQNDPIGLAGIILAQFDMAWALATYHLKDLTTPECLWRPAARGLNIGTDGFADWPTSEAYDIGPPSIGWVTWHICYWWHNALALPEGRDIVSPEQVQWPGSAEAVRNTIEDFRARWRSLLEQERNFETKHSTTWPIPNATKADLAAWLNLELMKNAAEIGLLRFAYAVSGEHLDSRVSGRPAEEAR